VVDRTILFLGMRPGIKDPNKIHKIWQTEPGHLVKHLLINELLAKQLQGRDLYNEDVILVWKRRIPFLKKSWYNGVDEQALKHIPDVNLFAV
jgi:hypothetical protein